MLSPVHLLPRLLLSVLISSPLLTAALPVLKVSENQRFLIQEDGKPFFYLADTAWQLIHRLSKEETTHYLRTRAAQGFNVIQTTVLAEQQGLTGPTPEGHLPLVDLDPTKPNEPYFAHLDWVFDQAEALGLYIALLPTWGDKWNRLKGTGPEVFTPENAGVYGEWLGKRYANRSLIWVVGGDRLIDNERHAAVIRAMANGLRKGDGGRNLITFHPSGDPEKGRSSARHFHDEPWLDFNMRQNGHGVDFNDAYEGTRIDYDRTPIKPVFDAEPIYEDHPIFPLFKLRGHSIAADVRRPLYWNLFTGAFGHAYGHHSVWQMHEPKHEPVKFPLKTWRDALDAPGAQQMVHGRRLMESRPFLTRIPDDELIVTEKVPTAMPGTGLYRFVATRDTAGTYAMIYAPIGRAFTVRLSKLNGKKLRAWWFDPRTGKAESAGEFVKEGTKTFMSPTPGEAIDWVLVLDDVDQNYVPPGSSKLAPDPTHKP
jgi:hypothetical protein